MAWCPKCKNEYREGITVCAECGCDLVEEDPSKTWVPLVFGEEEQIGLLADFLKSNGISGVEIRYAEEEQVYELFVKEADQKKATKCARIFLEQEALRAREQEALLANEEQERAEAESQAEAQQGKTAESGFVKPYHSSAEAAEDNRSSAWTLLLVGSIGLVVMLLGMLEVLPFSIGNPYLFYGVMSAIFLLFIVMGVVSMKNARIFEKKAESENSLKDTLLGWCDENLKGEEIDAELGVGEDIGPEVLYFRRIEWIKKKLNHQFVNLDQSFLDQFIDEEIYETVFAEEHSED